VYLVIRRCVIKYTKEKLQEAVLASFSVSQVIRYFGLKLTGGTHSHISKKIKTFEIDTSHFLGKATNCGDTHKGGLSKRDAKQVLVKSDKNYREKHSYLHKSLIEIGREYKCEFCSCDGTWNGDKITLQIDHIDGDWSNNLSENLRFLCPNCHSQTKTFGSKKINR
jgi:hypothetical protein